MVYDGDQISVKGCFTQEANKEAEELINSKAHILNVNGANVRSTERESIQTLYMFTKFVDWQIKEIYTYNKDIML